MQSALAVTKEMAAAGLSRNVYIYNILLDGWAQRGDVWEASDVMKQIRTDGIIPDVQAYTTFINACCKSGNMEKAKETMEGMEKVGIKPSLLTYTVMVKGWASASFPEQAFECFQQLKSTGLEPDYVLYSCLLHCLLSRASVAKDTVKSFIITVAEEMSSKGLCVNLDTAVRWEKFLNHAEHYPGELTKAVEKLFPPAWINKSLRKGSALQVA
ncbi:hypothetical protein L7F22_045057 [Adiantum nelumboides]|nr:hypothetical protein [Adiantum nelumboides]